MIHDTSRVDQPHHPSLFVRELGTILGLYEFGDRVTIVDPALLSAYPERLIVRHEIAHKALAECSLYGTLLRLLTACYNNVSREGLQETWGDLRAAIDDLLAACFRVQEGIALYDELSACYVEYPDKYEQKLSLLPQAYRDALSLVESALGSTSETYRLNGIPLEMAVTVGRAVLNRRGLTFLKNFPLTIIANHPDGHNTELRYYLQKNSPDQLFEVICTRIKERKLKERLLQIWVRLLYQEATKQGIGDIGEENDLPNARLAGRPQYERLLVAIQREFLQALREEAVIVDEDVCLDNEVMAQDLDEIRAAWFQFFRGRGEGRLFPFSSTQRLPIVQDPANATTVRTQIRTYGYRDALSIFEELEVARIEQSYLQIIAQGELPVVSLEPADQSRCLLQLLPARAIRVEREIDYQLRLPVLIGLVSPDVMARLSGLFQSKTPCFININAELLGKVVQPMPADVNGLILHSFDGMNMATICNGAAEMAKLGLPTYVRELHFTDAPYVFLVEISGHWDMPSIFAFPGKIGDLQEVERQTAGNDKVFVGKEKIEAALGQLRFTNEMYLLLSAAYFVDKTVKNCLQAGIMGGKG